jgi:hypothetical protein
MRRYSKVAQLRRLGVSVSTAVELDPSWTEEALDAMLAAEKNRQAELYEAFVRAGTVIVFRAFGVQVLQGDDKVYTIGMQDSWAKTNRSRLLGRNRSTVNGRPPVQARRAARQAGHTQRRTSCSALAIIRGLRA